jgi:hypothetical protein
MYKLLAAAAIFALAIAPSYAKTATGSQVTVDITAVKAEIAKNIRTDANNVPTTVQVPLRVAAGACGVKTKELTAQMKGGGNASCTAKRSSRDLAAAVKKEIK